MAEENSKSENGQTEKKGFLSGMSNDSITKTVIVTVALCLVCSVIVSGAAVVLKDKQVTNALNDKRANILQVAGLDDNSLSIDERFENIETKLVDLETGEYVEDIDPAEYDQRVASKDPERSINLSKQEDIASIKRRANIATVYLLKDDSGNVSKYILPVHGYGLWSTMYGFVSLENDLNTVYRLKFYEQGETAGLGGEVENPKWLSQWNGKKLEDESGEYKLFVGKGAPVSEEHQVDGLAGATLTTRGVNNLFKFWMNDMGFQAYFNKILDQQS